jgi:sigma-B regulation protein RsbU (phosphoserine phosphatase)
MPSSILVVDDEADLEQLVRQKFRRHIRDNEFNFFFARSGVEALETLAREKDINVVLTDINMPEMDGLTLLSRLTQHDGVLKAVVVSAYGDMENIRTAMNRGAFDFVTKPIDLNDFETTILKALREADTIKTAMRVREELVAIQRELNVATDIQLSMLPQVFPAFPERAEIDVHARMIAAKEVGGDFYDFFPIDDDRIGMVVGDVSGKGVPAALYGAFAGELVRSRTFRRRFTAERSSPAGVLASMNTILHERQLGDYYCTLCYALFDLKRRTVTIANSGLPYPIRSASNVRPDAPAASAPAQIELAGIPLGSFPGSSYDEATFALSSGDVFVFFTDGVSEAQDALGQEFGIGRLLGVIEQSRDKPARELVDAIFAAVQDFRGETTPNDDMTAVAIRITG